MAVEQESYSSVNHHWEPRRCAPLGGGEGRTRGTGFPNWLPATRRVLSGAPPGDTSENLTDCASHRTQAWPPRPNTHLISIELQSGQNWNCSLDLLLLSAVLFTWVSKNIHNKYWISHDFLMRWDTPNSRLTVLLCDYLVTSHLRVLLNLLQFLVSWSFQIPGGIPAAICWRPQSISLFWRARSQGKLHGSTCTSNR